MSALVPILAMAGSVYSLRIAGLLLAGRTVPPSWERALGFVPVATLTALVVSSLIGRTDEAPVRLVAALAAGLVGRRSGRAWLCILVGMALYWLLRLV